MPKLDATTPPSRAPTQFPPAATNRPVLPTRPSISGGVSRCRSEAPTMVHSAPCTPKANNAKPMKYALREVARARCIPASISRPIRIVQVAVTHPMSRSPMTEPRMPPAAMHVGEAGAAGDLDPGELGPVFFGVAEQPQGDGAAGGGRDGGHLLILPSPGACPGYDLVPGNELHCCNLAGERHR